MKTKAILIGCICEMAAVLLQQNVLGKVVEILILLASIANTGIAPLDVRRPNDSAGITHNQLLMVPPPDIPVQVPLDRLTLPLRIQQKKAASAVLEAVDQLLLGPKLHIVDEENYIDSSLAGLDQLEQSGICCRRRIDCVCCYPKVLPRLVNHLPYSPEESISLDDELS